MAILDYYNDNRYIDWPFLPGLTGRADGTTGTLEVLPQSAIVDVGFLCGPHAQFQADNHHVRLWKVYIEEDVLYFDVRSDAPALEGFRLLFSFGVNDPDYSTSFGEAESLEEFDGCIYEGIWSGFLVVGSVADVVAAIGELEAMESPDAYFEPATIQILNSRVLSVTVANQDRTKTRPTRECDENFGEEIERPIRIVASCQIGPIRFDDGHNVAVQQEDAANRISFAAGAGSGKGISCEELLTYPEEEPETEGGLLTGGPRCEELVAFVNGVSGKNIRLYSEKGVRIVADPDNHAILLAAGASSSASCES
jgi:hypothetical protein